MKVIFITLHSKTLQILYTVLFAIKDICLVIEL